MLYAIVFTIGAVLVTSLIYAALNPRAAASGGENPDLRFIGYALVLIIITAITVVSLLLLGKIDEVKLPF